MSWQISVTIRKTGMPPARMHFATAPLTIGADLDNDIVITDAGVASAHASVLLSSGSLVISSADGQRIEVGGEPTRQARLGQSGSFHIGSCELKVALEELTRRPGSVIQASVAKAGQSSSKSSSQAGDKSAASAPSQRPDHEPSSNNVDPRAGTEPIDESVAAAMLRSEHVGLSKPDEDGSPAAPVAGESRAVARLRLNDGEDQPNRFFPLNRGAELTIGRGDVCDIQLPLRFVSRHHATVSISDNGVIRVRDENSINGTFVNGQPLLRVGTLAIDDELGIASVVFEVVEPHVAHTTRLPATTFELRSSRHSPETGVAVVSLNGCLNACTYQNMQQAIENALCLNFRHLIMDLSEVSQISQIGLGVLVSEVHRRQERGGRMFVVGAGGTTRQIIEDMPRDALARNCLLENAEEALEVLREESG